MAGIDWNQVYIETWKIIKTGLAIILSKTYPYIIGLLIGIALLPLIKYVAKFFSQVSGDTKRQTKKKLEAVENTYNLIDFLHNIFK